MSNRSSFTRALSVSLAAATAAVLASTTLSGTATAAPAKPKPTPFPTGAIATVYPSDISSHPSLVYYEVADGFNDLQARHRGVLRQNLQTTIRINNAAKGDRALVNRALDDEHDDLLVTMSDALGAKLGSQFRTALKQGRLPKTEQLLSGTLARGGGPASSTFPEKLAFSYPRPFVVAPNKIVEYHRPGEAGPYKNDPLSTAYPSGHTNQATWKAMMWAMMVPEFSQPLLARAQEVGYNRMVMGVHYPLDVIGGRMTGLSAAADRWNDARFRPLIRQAGAEIRAELQWRCGDKLTACIARDTPYLGTPAQINARYLDQMNYGFPRIYRANAKFVAPAGATALLGAKHPRLNHAQRVALLRKTAYPAGYPLDDQSGDGSWQRLNLARALAAKVTVGANGAISIQEP